MNLKLRWQLKIFKNNNNHNLILLMKNFYTSKKIDIHISRSGFKDH